MTVHKTLNQALIIFLLFLLAACQQTPNPQTEGLEAQAPTWTQLGKTLDTTTSSRIDNVEIVVDSIGNPVVAWQGDFQENGKIYVKRWNNTQNQWASLGIVTTLENTSDLELAVGKNKLGIAFNQSTFTTTDVTSRIRVKRLTGNSWEQVGPALRNDLGSSFSLVMDKHENPFVSFEYNDDIYVKRWKFNSTTYQYEWQQMGGKLNTPTGNVSNAVFAQNPKIILAGFNQTPFVAWFEINWSEAPVKVGVRIKRWENGAWVPFDFIETVAHQFFYFQKDRYGFPVVTAEDNSGTVNIWSWNNSVRSLRASLDANNGFPHFSSLAFNSLNQSMMIYTKGFKPSKLSVKRWDGSSWVSVGQGVDEAPIGYDQVAMVADTLGRPIVARAEIEPGVPNGFQSNLYVQRYQ
jgi:hypothetical protein